MIAFLDASALIYLLEGQEPFATQVRTELAKLAKRRPAPRIAMSRLSWLECRVGPARRRDTATLALFAAFFMRTDLVWVDLVREVVELATTLRISSGLRTPDALQAASCLHLGGSHLFITGDAAFRMVSGLDVRLLTSAPD